MARRRVFLCILAILIAQIVVRPAQAQAAQWANLATVSNSTSLQAGSLCATDGRDIYCNSSVATLSGLAQADRIISGTTSISAISNTGYISVTQSGVNTAYFHPSMGLVTMGVSSTRGISGTTGYFSGALTVGNASTTLIQTGDDVRIGSSGSGSNGGDIVGIGANAASSNSGTDVVGIGSLAANGNTGSNVVAIGRKSGRLNNGNLVTSIGYFAAQQNSGTYVTAVGANAASLNNGTNVVGVGYLAAASNAGSYVDGVGTRAAYMNTGSYVAGLGYQATRENSGSYIVGLGYRAGYQNLYSNVVLLGRDTKADKDYQVVLGGPGTVEVTTTGVILAAGISTTGTVSATDIKLARNATPPAAKCASAADEGRTIMTADGPYVCLMR